MMNPLSRAMLALLRRWRKNIFSLSAVLFCAATLVALQGITLSSSDRTAQRFIQMESPTLTVSLPDNDWTMKESAMVASARQIAQVNAIGSLVVPQGMEDTVSLSSPRWHTNAHASVAVGTMQGLQARGARVAAGLPLPTDGASELDTDGVLLGTRLASELGITMNQGLPVVRINQVDMRVCGIVEDAQGQSVLATTVVMTPQTARRLGLLPNQRSLLVAVEPGSAEKVSRYLPYALLPQSPEAVSVKVPASPQALRDSLMEDSHATTLIITAIMAVVTAFSIINTMQMSVNDRRKEIGISLALGMPARHIAVQFLIESMAIGLVGASLGLLVGTQVAAAVALSNGWRYLLPASCLWVPLFGASIGALSGLFPASQATRIKPAELLRAT